MNLPRRRPRRLLAGILAGALALSASPLLGVQPAGAADALPPLADPIADGAFCDGAPTSNPFNDLGAESASTREAIICLVATELTTGTSAKTYSPGGIVTRRQMAVFIQRLADLLETLEIRTPGLPTLPAYDGSSDFSDVAANDPAATEIGQLSQADIVGGFSDGTFRPNTPVSRRQMAAFINRLQEFLGGAPFSTTKDYFVDDEGDSGEANLNALAAVGIFQGDGAGKVFPGASITRRQMANILLRDAQVYYANGIVSGPFATPNQDFPVNPTANVVLEHNKTRQFTATGLDPAARYDIKLFSCANVTGSGTSPITFAPQSDATKADPGTTTGAALTVVNGANTANGDNVTPVSDRLTFTLTSTATVCVVPVVFKDTVDDDTLNINGAKQPTDLFGIGGDTQFVPAEAAAGAPASGEVTLVGSGFAVLGNTATVYFHGGDTYRIQGSAPPFATVTSAVFLQNLTVGDSLRTCQSELGLPDPYTRGAANEYCLTDTTPVGPTAVNATAGTPSDDAINLTWTASATPGVTAHKVYANADTCTNTVVAELTSLATVAAPTASYTATGLAPSTTYCFVVTAMQGSDESALAVGSPTAGNDSTVERATTGPIEAPTIASAGLTDTVSPGQVTADDVITLRFSEAMDPATVTNALIAVTDNNGDTTSIRCAASPVVADNDNTDAACVLGNGPGPDTVNNDTLTITLAEDGDDANPGGDGSLRYSLTISSITILKDADDAQAVNVAGSADNVIG